MPATVLSLLIAAFAILAGAGSAAAAEIKVLTAGAMRGVVDALLPAFEKATGHKVTLDNATAGVLAKRIGDDEAFDLAIITPSVIDALVAKGKISAPRVDLAKVGIGVAVKDGAPAPDIATVEAFKAALLAAKSVAYIDPKAGGSSGIYFDGLIDRLGSGEAELAVHQISEILPVKGVRLVGPLPAEIQNTTVYAAGLGAAAKEPVAAKALLDHLAGAPAAAVLSAKGMEKP
jgi:molybdate transport system substrate-binding protein